MTENTTEARKRLGDACDAMADGNELVRLECNAMEALMDGPEAEPGAVKQAHARVRAAGMKAMGLTTVYLSELNTYMTARDRPRA